MQNTSQKSQPNETHLYELRLWLKEKKHKRSPYGGRLDRNGYAFSLLDLYNGECFICGLGGDTARHEVYFGSDRETSKSTGCWVTLCVKCHERVHLEKRMANGETYDHWLKKTMQEKFEREYSHEDFMELYGVNYL